MLEGLSFVPYLLKHRRKTYSQMKCSVFKGLEFRVISDHYSQAYGQVRWCHNNQKNEFQIERNESGQLSKATNV